MFTILLVLLMINVCALVIAILLQRSRGGGLVGALGGTGGDTFLGGLQSKELVKLTTWLAICFFALSLLLDFFPPERRSENFDELGGGAVPSVQTVEPNSEGVNAEVNSDEEVGGGLSESIEVSTEPVVDDSAPIEVDPDAPEEGQ